MAEIKMKVVAGIHLPEADEHFAEHLENSPHYRGFATYQLRKYQKALEFVKGRRMAVDVGAHVGLWSMMMRHDFKAILAFEPMAEHIACFKMNLEGRSNVDLQEIALGAEAGELKMSPTSANSGNAHINPRGRRKVDVKRLDDFKFNHLDFLKIDVEGFELDVLKGGEKTVRHFRPVVIVEQKPGNAERFGYRQTEAVDLLKSWGARLRFEKGGDYCLSW